MKLIFKYLKNRFFTSSERYWENRYKSGGIQERALITNLQNTKPLLLMKLYLNIKFQLFVSWVAATEII